MTPTVTEEEALWLTVGERPDDELPRLVLAEKLQACSEALGRAAEKGRVCGCQQQPRAEGGES